MWGYSVWAVVLVAVLGFALTGHRSAWVGVAVVALVPVAMLMVKSRHERT